MSALFTAVILLTALISAGLVGMVIRRRGATQQADWWASGIPAGLSVACVALLSQPISSLASGLLALCVVGIAAGAGVVILRDTRPADAQWRNRWLIFNAAWVVVLTVTLFISGPLYIGQADWLVRAFNPPHLHSLILIAGYLTAGTLLNALLLQSFYRAPLPEVANRALYWVVVVTVLFVGLLLLMAGTALLSAAGALTTLVGIGGVIYALRSWRVFNIRSSFTLAARGFLLVGAMSLLIVLAIVIFGVGSYATSGDRWLATLALALLTSLLYVPLRALIARGLNWLVARAATDPGQATRLYSQQVSKALELDQLLKVSTETLKDVLKVRSSALLLVSDSDRPDGQVELLLMAGDLPEELKGQRAFIAQASPVYRRLAADQAPLTQFDIHYAPAYAALPAPERGFFNRLHMNAYAPVIVDNALIGVLACGPKRDDSPFYSTDLDVLATLANQTGVALRNARLVADLRHLNTAMNRLNKGLEEARNQVQRLDSVKTDFVTIASHELRTPLAQLRGYTDIIDAVNQQGMLDPDQTTTLVGNLRKATERMEELITAMLDVSQLDVKAMDLRFTSTTPEAVLRLASEPLLDVVKQRKQTLSARGLKSLPPIQADMQRLVQAVRNVVVNAIKFTPDGGRIEITGSLQPASTPDERDTVLIVVADTGVGIAPENRELVFRKFFRAYDPGLHSTGSYKFMGAGPGLGLTIARGIIEGHGGKIWAESPGHNMETFPGATFYIQLPVSPPEGATRVKPFETSGIEKVVSG
jgi:signal transduction histidine kinase